ncbi:MULTISPECIES: hypothetical protein [unclassified Brevibacterium]|uniref:hypothetical protein n=1 Tax=unclassified Brevibacterium TaxID=2614124 RepID=UPI000C6A578D|nr:MULTISPECIES: hypothetical protein [unclassified Brevibacterium]SMX91236.1 hypothetical protein BSP239C_02260 [Brevibacterium sp. 239c]
MNWDEKAAARAYERAVSDEQGSWFEEGAAWQRSALETPESVDRAAEAIWERNHGPAEKPVTWETTLEEIRELWREDARAVIAALNQGKW